MAGRPKGIAKTGGRKKGTPNKVTRDVKEAIENAFTKLGGEKYLAKLGRQHPSVFAVLLGKLLPMQVTGQGGGPLKAEVEHRHAGGEAALQRASELLARALAIGSPGTHAQADTNGPVLPIEVCAGTLGHGASVAPGAD